MKVAPLLCQVRRDGVRVRNFDSLAANRDRIPSRFPHLPVCLCCATSQWGPMLESAAFVLPSLCRASPLAWMARSVRPAAQKPRRPGPAARRTADGEPTGIRGRSIGVILGPSTRARISCRSSTAGGWGCPNWNRYERPLEAPYVTRPVVGSLQPERPQGRLPDPRPEHLHQPVGHLRHAVRGPPPAHAEQRQLRQVRTAPTSSATATSCSSTRTSSSRWSCSRATPPSSRATGSCGLTGVFNFNYLNDQGERRRQHRRPRGHRPLRGARQPAGVLRRVPPGRPHAQLRLPLDALGHPGLHQRLPRLHLQRQQRWASGCSATWAPTGDQFNAAYFRPLEKDTNSGLNRLFDTRGQHLGDRQLLPPGLPHAGLHAAAQRPLPARRRRRRTSTRTGSSCGRPSSAPRQMHTIDAVYLGWTGDGHIGPLNVTHAFYQVARPRQPQPDLGAGSRHQRADGRPRAVDGLRLGPAEVHRSSGPPATTSRSTSRSRGFDSILDNPNFAGGGFSYWVRQGIGLPTTSLELNGRNSLAPGAAQQQDRGPAELRQPGPVPVRPRRRLRGDAEGRRCLRGQLASASTTPSRCRRCSSRIACGTTWAGTSAWACGGGRCSPTTSS